MWFHRKNKPQETPLVDTLPIPVRPDQEQLSDEELDFSEYVEFDRITESILTPWESWQISRLFQAHHLTIRVLTWLERAMS